MAEPQSSKRMPCPPTDRSVCTQASAAPERQQASVRYIDRADMAETFADSITGLIFDGQALRIEFGITRFDEL